LIVAGIIKYKGFPSIASALNLKHVILYQVKLCLLLVIKIITSFSKTGKKIAAVAVFEDTSVKLVVIKQANIIIIKGGKTSRPIN